MSQMTRFLALCPLILVTLMPAATPPVARAGDEHPPSGPVLIKASPTILTDGTHCRLQLRESVTSSGRESVTYVGRISGSNSEGLFVQVEEEERRVEQRTEPMASIPFLSRFFRNLGIGRRSAPADQRLWIPSENVALIEVLPPDQTRQPKP